MMHSVSRPLPPIPTTNAISAASPQRSNPMMMIFHRNMLPPPPPPPPPNEPPPPPMSPPLMTAGKSPFTHRILSPIHTGLQGPRSPQTTRVTPRPRVPRMGTSVPPTQSPTFGSNGADGHMEFVGPTRILESRVSLGNTNLVQPCEPNCFVKFGLQQNTSRTTTLIAPVSSSIQSGTRLTSSSVSTDFRKLFGRSDHLPHTKGNALATTGRLTPISERTLASSSPSTKQSYFSDYSLSDSELSDVTETTNLSLTWPLSRSQTDLSTKLYRSFSKVHLDESVTERTPSAQGQSNARLIVNTPPIRQVTAPTLKAPAIDCHVPSTEFAELKEWMTQLDQDEIVRRFKRMRMVTMTARRWTIKRRPDGTRYLAYRRSQGTRCCQHSVPSTSKVTRQLEDQCCTHATSPECHETRSSTGKPVEESNPPEQPSRRKRHKSHRSTHCPCAWTNPSVPAYRADRPESFPPSTQSHLHCSTPQADHPRPPTRPEIVTTTATGSSRSTHKRSRHRGRRMDATQDLTRSARNASCCFHRPEPRPDCLPGERAYLYCLATTRSQDRAHDAAFSSLCPVSRSNGNNAEQDTTKLVTMLVV